MSFTVTDYRNCTPDFSEGVDVIVVSLGDTPERRAMTNTAINTLLASDQLVHFNIVVVEHYKDFLKEGHVYEGCTVVVPQEEKFNYNLYLKYGIKHSSGAPWTVLANNDLIFHRGWMTTIMKMYTITGINSFSPWNDSTHPSKFPGQTKLLHVGYRVAYELAGWCMVVRREVLDRMELDTRVMFWYSDNVYADELKRLKERHALVSESLVTHLESATIKVFNKDKLHQYTHQQTKNYYEKK
jgi:hypothetical protein